MYYFKILEVFILGVLMDKDEYNIFSKSFKPVKVVMVTLLWLNVIFSIYMVRTLIHVRAKIEAECAHIIPDSVRITTPKAVVTAPPATPVDTKPK